MVLHQVRLTFGQLLGQADLWSDVPPSRGIYWPRVVLHQISLAFGLPLDQADLWSDISLHPSPPVEASSGKTDTTSGKLTCGQPVVRCNPSPNTPFCLLHLTPPLAEASSGQEWYYFQSFDIWSVCCQMSPHSPIHLHCPYTLCPHPITPLPPLKASSGQEWYYFGSARHLVSLWSHVPPMPPPQLITTLSPVVASSGQEWYYFGSAWHLVSLWIRLTFAQIYPCPLNTTSSQWTSHGQVYYYFDQVDLWSDFFHSISGLWW